MSTRPYAPIVILTAAVCLTLASRVFVDFSKLRVKVVEAPADAVDGRVVVSTQTFADVRALPAPAALIARIRNATGTRQTFTVAAGSADICRASVAPGEHRIDCAIADPAETREVRVIGPPGGWALTYLELATHHGNTSGVGYLVILPGNSTNFVRPSLRTIVLVTAGVALLLLVPGQPFPRWLTILHKVLSAGIGAAAIAALVSPYVSPYLLIVSMGTFVVWLFVVAAPRCWFALRWVSSPPTVARSRFAQLGRSLLVAAMVLVVYEAFVQHRLRDEFQGNYSGFLLISRDIVNRNLLLGDRNDVKQTLRLVDGGGYDGQYMYVVSFDPLLRRYAQEPVKYREVVDAVPYRFGRIGYPWLTRLFSGNQWSRFPTTMVSLVVLSLGVAAFALAEIAQETQVSAALGLIVLLIPGFWPSVETGLPEPIAAAGFLAGYLSVRRERWLVAGLLFALSLLVRETGAVAVGCVLIALFAVGRRQQSVYVGVVALAPVLLWRAYMAWVLFPDWGWEGFFYHPGDLGLPFRGLIDMTRAISQHAYYPGAPTMARAGIAFPVLLIVATGVAALLALRAPSAATVACLVYALIADCLNFRMIWVNVNNGQRGTFELFVMAALGLIGYRAYEPWLRRVVWGLWVLIAAYGIFFAADAEDIRRTVMAF